MLLGLALTPMLTPILTELLTLPNAGKGLDAGALGRIYGIDEDDAEVMMEWITKSMVMNDVLNAEGMTL